MASIDLILVPYDSAQRGVRMGAGPLHLLERGAAERLRGRGHDVRETVVEARRDFRAEPGTAFELARSLSLAVRTALGRGSFPLVLAGNCSSALGTLGGIGADGTAVVWLDAHGDFNTPDTTASGFFDGTSLAAVTGRCWKTAALTIDGFAPVAEERVALVGARDLDPGERALLDASHVTQVGVDAVRGGGLDGVLATLASRAQRAYLHVDMDVHDPAEGRANVYATPGGLAAAEVGDVARAVAARLPLAAAAVTALDPAEDADGRMTEAALALVELLAELGGSAA